jgi:uncharacterized protein (DUF924 family)
MPDRRPRPVSHDVLSFWFGVPWPNDWPDAAYRRRWFASDKVVDTEIRQRFGAWLTQALSGGLTEWEQAIPDRLALVLLLDQFTRNAHRGTGRAFAGDARAQQLVLESLAHHHDEGLPAAAQVFLLMPLMHAEDLHLQQTCVERFERLCEKSPPPLKTHLASHLDAARQHHDIIARFGRFPHRNTALGRMDTPQETAFLRHGPRFGQ